MNLFHAIKEELLQELPGYEVQKRLAPDSNRIFHPKKIKQHAAVSIVLLAGKEKTEIIFTRRAIYDGHHSGQISFPGGKEEINDNSLLETAIRETYEEIGLSLSKQNCLGKLTPLYIPVSDFMVHPFVFFHPAASHTEFILDKKEVTYVILADIKTLLEKNIIKTTTLKIDDTIRITTPYFDIKEEIVWGATAMILSEFKEIIKNVVQKGNFLPD